MKLDLLKVEPTETLTGQSDVFKGTSLENESFSVTLQNIEKTHSLNLSQQFRNEDGTLQVGGYSEEIFKQCIVAVSGLEDRQGVELELNDDVKKALWDKSPVELQEAIAEVISIFNKNEKKSEIVSQDLVQNTQDGAYIPDQHV